MSLLDQCANMIPLDYYNDVIVYNCLSFQMPFHHMMVGPAGAGGHEVGHSRISSQKHSNKVGGGGYQGNSGSANYWSSGAAHTS